VSAVFAYETGAVKTEDNGELLYRHIVDYMVVASLEEARVYADKGLG